MRIFPYYFETLVLPISADDVTQILLKNTGHQDKEPNQSKKFTGLVETPLFRISEKLQRPDNFIPLIKGKIESTTKGSIIFTSYNLLFSTALFVAFWSVITLLLSFLFLFEFNHPLYSAISFGAFLLNYLFTSANFHRKVKGARQTFYNLFTT